MSVAIAPLVDAGTIMEEVIVQGDLAKLTPQQRATYYGEVCRSMGLNPLTQPFLYITLNGKLTLYAARTATDQLRKINGVSIEIVSRETANDVHIVTARATDATGRTDSEIGAVSVGGLKGEAYANALMKATTKAKRRVTLSICGLGWLDETEVEAIPAARPVEVTADGEILDAPPARRIGPGRAEAAPDGLKAAKAALWAEAQRRGLSKGMLDDYAQTSVGAGLGELTAAAVDDLTAILAAEEDNAGLLDFLSNKPAGEAAQAGLDGIAAGGGADQWTA